MRYWTVISVSTLSIAVLSHPAQGQIGDTMKPMDPWAFRADMDALPSAIAMSFNDRLSASFDTEKCSINLIWRGQPERRGKVASRKEPEFFLADRYREYWFSNTRNYWVLRNKQGEEPLRPHFKGYSFDKYDEITLYYELETAAGERIKVEEKPRYSRNEKTRGVVFDRNFKFEGIPQRTKIALNLSTHVEQEITEVQGKAVEVVIPKIDDPTRGYPALEQAKDGKSTLHYEWSP